MEPEAPGPQEHRKTESLTVETIILKKSLFDELESIHSIRELAEMLFIEHPELVLSFKNIYVLLKIFLTLPVKSA